MDWLIVAGAVAAVTGLSRWLVVCAQRSGRWCAHHGLFYRRGGC